MSGRHLPLLRAGALALAGAAALWLWIAWPPWLALLVGVTVPFAAAAALQREYGRWLLWVIRLEGGTLWVSQKFPPITEPRPMVTRPRMLASE